MSRDPTRGLMWVVALVGAVLVLQGCSQSGTVPSVLGGVSGDQTGARLGETGSARFTVVWPTAGVSARVIPTGTRRIEVHVLHSDTGAEIQRPAEGVNCKLPYVFDRLATDTDPTETALVNGLPAKELRFAAKALGEADSQGNRELLATGEATELVPAGDMVTVHLPMSATRYWGRLVFGRSITSTNSEIYTRDLLTGVERQLTRTDRASGYPAWSKDGSRIAWAEYESRGYSIYAMDADGENVDELVDSTDWTEYRMPHWNPVTDEIVYLAGWSYYVPTRRTWAVNPSTRVKRRIVDEDAAMASWSPAGDALVFVSDRGGGKDDIYMMNATTGGDVVRLTQTTGAEAYPVLSPNGAKLAYVYSPSGTYYATDAELYVLDLVTNQATRLTTNSLMEGDPAWSPDGKYIAYYAATGSNVQGTIYIIEATGGSPTSVCDGNFPDWAP